eukprot:gb/GECH01009714.1/.p1 GENE.gb/GECH01009714.1/~~gb/GECH01009714.1/.p1  ORF type:complete len:1095 (+),score=203.45 gb/GECH01009714.1/:1-3285(+)
MRTLVELFSVVSVRSVKHPLLQHLKDETVDDDTTKQTDHTHPTSNHDDTNSESDASLISCWSDTSIGGSSDSLSDHTKQGVVIDAYPRRFRGDPMMEEMPRFCLAWEPDQEATSSPPASCFSFVCTDETKRELYASVLRWQLPSGNKEPVFLCLFSRLPFYHIFAEFLTYLYDEHIFGREDVFRAALTQPNPLDYPSLTELRRDTINIIDAALMPPPGKIRITTSFLSEKRQQIRRIYYSIPEADDFPLLQVSFSRVFSSIYYRDFITVMNYALFDHPIALVSNDASLLNECAEAIRGLLYPLQWEYPFFPLLPPSLAVVLESPTPFIAGILPSCVQEATFIETLLIVDLDRHKIIKKPDLPLVPFPQEERMHLEESVKSLLWSSVNGEDHTMSTDSEIEDRPLRELFLSFFNNIVGNIDEFQTTSSHVFDDDQFREQEYIRSRPAGYKMFISALTDTTAFKMLRQRIADNDPFVQLYQDISGIDADNMHQVFKHNKSNDRATLAIDIDVATLDRLRTQDARLRFMLEKVANLIREWTQDIGVQMRLFLLRGWLFEEMGRPLNALQDISCVCETEPRIIDREWILSLIHHLDETQLEFVANMGDVVRKIAGEHNRYSSALRAPRTQIPNQQDSRKKRFQLFHKTTPFLIEHAEKKLHTDKNQIDQKEFSGILMDANIAAQRTAAEKIFDSLSEGEQYVSSEMARTFLERLTQITDVNKRFSDKLRLQDDAVVAVSSLCTNETGALGRLVVTYHRIFFGVSSFTEVVRIPDIKDAAQFQQDIPGRAPLEGIRITVLKNEDLDMYSANGMTFVLLSGQSAICSYIEKLMDAHFQSSPGISIQTNVEESGTLIVVMQALRAMNKKPKITKPRPRRSYLTLPGFISKRRESIDRDPFGFSAAPSELSAQLLQHLIDAFRDHVPDQRFGSNNKKKLNLHLSKVKESRQFQRFLDLAVEVSNVNPLRLGMSREQLISFFVNMHNIIVLHSLVSKGAKSLSNMLSRRSFVTTGSYEFGGFTVNLEEIRNGILLKKKPLRGPNIRLNSICISEPRVLFVLSLCTYSSPPVRILHPHDVDDVLNSAAEEELISSVHLDVFFFF